MIHYITPDGIAAPWVAAEIRGLQERNLEISLHSMRAPRKTFFGSDWAAKMNAETGLIYPLPKARLAFDLLAAPTRFGGRFWSALWNALIGEREHLRARIAGVAHLAVACHWAASLRGERVDRIHAQWIHSGGTIGMYGAWLLGVPFSFTGHAADLFRDRCALRDKVRRADFIVCISEFHRQLYRELGADDSKLHTVYCGIDVGVFECQSGGLREPPLRILSLGRLVEKKGFDVLIRACKELAERGREFECIIGGDGPLHRELQQQVADLGLKGRVRVDGKAILQEELPAFFRRGAVFVQSCVWSKDNDVDGTPRTMMEAMACGLPCVASRIAGLPDMIADGESGFLVEPGDARQLADAIDRLLLDESLAKRIGAAGRRYIEAKFDIDENLDRLAAIMTGEELRSTTSASGTPGEGRACAVGSA